MSLGLPRVVEVHTPEEILRARDQYPEEDLICSRIPRHTLLQRGKMVDTGIFDFDFTLTGTRSQWHEVQIACLRGTAAEDEDRDRDFYYGGKPTWGGESPYPQNDAWLKDAGCRDLSSEQAAYGTRTIMRWAMAGVTRSKLRKVGAKIALREGVADVFNEIERRVIISFGIEELIEACLEANKLSATVVANRLFYDQRGRVRSHHPHVVVNATKQLIARQLLAQARTPAEHVLCIGDSVGDIEMAPPFGLNILLLPRDTVSAQIGKWRDGQLPQLWDKVRCVVISDTFYPVWELVRRI